MYILILDFKDHFLHIIIIYSAIQYFSAPNNIPVI